MQVGCKLAQRAEDCWCDISAMVLGSLLSLMVEKMRMNVRGIRNSGDTNVDIGLVRLGRQDASQRAR
eukprot:3003136-Amphidinium_carterae.1